MLDVCIYYSVVHLRRWKDVKNPSLWVRWWYWYEQRGWSASLPSLPSLLVVFPLLAAGSLGNGGASVGPLVTVLSKGMGCLPSVFPFALCVIPLTAAS